LQPGGAEQESAAEDRLRWNLPCIATPSPYCSGGPGPQHNPSPTKLLTRRSGWAEAGTRWAIQEPHFPTQMDPKVRDVLLDEAIRAHERARGRSDTVASNAGVVISAALAAIVAVGLSFTLARGLLPDWAIDSLAVSVLILGVSSILSGWSFFSGPPVAGPTFKSVENSATKDPTEGFLQNLTTFYVQAEAENTTHTVAQIKSFRLSLGLLLAAIFLTAVATSAGIGWP
jgi:hypothetical protein